MAASATQTTHMRAGLGTWLPCVLDRAPLFPSSHTSLLTGNAAARAGSTAAAQAHHAQASAFSIHCTPPPRAPSALGPSRAAGPGCNPSPDPAPTADHRRGRLDRRASSSDCEGGPGAVGGPGLGSGVGHSRAVERGGSGLSTSGRMDSGSIELPVLPWVDWQIPAEEIRICRRPNGAEWELGSGAFGKARSAGAHAPSPL